MPSSLDGFRTIRKSLRPGRVAILVKSDDRDWMQTCLRIIEWTTTVWGGWYTCVVPTDGNTIDERFWTILQRFDPDYICRYQKTGRDVRIADIHYFEELVDRRYKEFTIAHPYAGQADSEQVLSDIAAALDYAPAERFEISDVLKIELKRRLNPFTHLGDIILTLIQARADANGFPLTDISNVISNLRNPPSIKLLDLDTRIEMLLMIYSMSGRLSDDYINKLQATGIALDSESYDEKSTLRLLEPLWKGALYASALPLANCGIYQRLEDGFKPQPALIVIGDTFEDFCLYLALHRMRGHTMWLPWSILQRAGFRFSDAPGEATSIETAILVSLSRFLDHEYRQSGAMLMTSTLNMSDFEIAKGLIQDQIGTIAIEPCRDLATALPWVRRIYERDNVDLRYRDQFIDGTSVNLIDTPIPKQLAEIPPFGLFWISEVSVERYKVPQRPGFGPATIVARTYGSGEVRATNDGFAYFSPYHSYAGGDIHTVVVRPEIRLMEPLGIFSLLFEEAGYDISYSDKGNYHLECFKKFGSLETFAAFWRSNLNRQAIEAYSGKGKSETGRGDKIDQRRYLDLIAFERVVGLHDGLITEKDDISERSTREVTEKAAQLVESFIGLGIIHRGLILMCQTCRQLDWYDIEDVGNNFRCLRCRTRQAYRRQHWGKTPEPSWFYKLDEILYQFQQHNGYIPLLALDLMRLSARESFFYIPEIELKKPKRTKEQEMELDFCCCSDGKVYIGEGKKASKLEQSEQAERATLTKFRKIVEDIQGEALVLGTSEDKWSNRTVALANEVFENRQPRYYTGQQLFAKSES